MDEKDEKLNSSRKVISPPKMINNTSIISNYSNSFSKSGDFETFNTQDRELLDILEQLGKVGKAKGHDVNVTSLGRLRGHYVLTLSVILAIGFCQMQRLDYLKKARILLLFRGKSMSQS